MSNLPIIWLLGDEQEKWFCDIRQLLHNEFTIAPVHSNIILKKLIEVLDPYSEISPIVIVDSQFDRGKGIDIAREIQSNYRNVRVILITRSDEPTLKFEPNDTFELVELPLRSQTLANIIRLHTRKMQVKAISKSWIEASNFLMERDKKDEILSKIVELAPSIVAKSKDPGSKPFAHFAQLEIDKEKCILRFHEKHHNPKVWKMLKEKTQGEILLRSCTVGHPEGLRQLRNSYLLSTSNALRSQKIGIIGLAVLEKRTQRINDVTDDQWKPFYIQLDPAIHSQLAVPIFVDNKVYGVINLEHPDKGAFDKGDEQELEALSKLIAIAVKKVETAESLQISTSRFQSIYAATQAIIGSHLDVDETLAQIIRQALKMIGCTPSIDKSFANIRQLDKTGQVLHLVAVDPPGVRTICEEFGIVDMEMNPKKPKKKGITVRAATANTKQLVKNVNDINEKDYIQLSPDIQAQLSVPLNDSTDRVIGVLTIEVADPNVFTQDAIYAIELLAHVAGIALESANIFGDAKKQLKHTLESLQVDHSAARIQSNQLYTASLYMTIFSTFALFIYVLTGLWWKLDVETFPIIAGIISQILGAVFFARVDKANSRLDDYYNSRLTRIEGFKMLLDECLKLPADKQIEKICSIIDDYELYLKSLDDLSINKLKPV